MACWFLTELKRVYLLGRLPNEKKSHYALGQAVLIINLSSHMMQPVFYERVVCFNQILTLAWDVLSVCEVLRRRWLGRSEELLRFAGCRTQNLVVIRHQSICARTKPRDRCSWDLLLVELFLCKEEKKHLLVQTDSASAQGSK